MRKQDQYHTMVRVLGIMISSPHQLPVSVDGQPTPSMMALASYYTLKFIPGGSGDGFAPRWYDWATMQAHHPLAMVQN
jgi:hypothetical protein